MLNFPHIIRHGLTLYLDLSALALFVAACITRWITGKKDGLAGYLLLAAWALLIAYTIRIM